MLPQSLGKNRKDQRSCLGAGGSVSLQRCFADRLMPSLRRLRDRLRTRCGRCCLPGIGRAIGFRIAITWRRAATSSRRWVMAGFRARRCFYNGAQASEGRLVAARVESDGKLVTVTESQVGDFLTNRVTAVEMARENSFQVSSLEADSEAIADVPQHLFPLKPEGMARGTHLHTAIVRDWMILDPLEKPVRPTTVYYRCGGRLS